MRDKGRGREVADYYKRYPEARLVQMANAAEGEISKLRKQKRQALEKGNEERVKIIERLITQRMRRFNERMDLAEDKAA